MVSAIKTIGNVGSITARPVTGVNTSHLGSNIETGLQKASAQNQAYLEEAKALYDPYKQTGLSSLDEYTKLLLGGVDGLSQDQNFQAMQDLAEKRVMANRAVSGLLRSGATANTLDDTLLNFANQYYTNRLNQLQGGVQYGTGAAGAQTSILEKLGGNATDLASALANIQMQREGNQATIDAARAQANATTSAAKSKSESDLISAGLGAVGTIAGALIFSDKRLKTDLVKVGKSDNGLNIYLGRYTKESGLDDGKQHLFLIAQEVKEVMPEAVVENADGYYMVDYAKALNIGE